MNRGPPAGAGASGVGGLSAVLGTGRVSPETSHMVTWPRGTTKAVAAAKSVNRVNTSIAGGMSEDVKDVTVPYRGR